MYDQHNYDEIKKEKYIYNINVRLYPYDGNS